MQQNAAYVTSVLLKKKQQDIEELEEKIAFEIATLLQSDPHTLDELLLATKSGTEQEKLTQIRALLDAGKIKTDGKNYYL